jgi:sporulation protein YlmC with PRC-barrel domain
LVNVDDRDPLTAQEYAELARPSASSRLDQAERQASTEADEDKLTRDQESMTDSTGAVPDTAAEPSDNIRGAADSGTIRAEDIIRLGDWDYRALYRNGMSTRAFMRDTEVYDPDGNHIGEVEDVILSRDGKAISIIAEVGGFLDIGDTHVSVPWNEIRYRTGGQGLVIPVREDTVENYSIFNTGRLTSQAASQRIIAGVADQPTGRRAFRASELIGSYTRLKDDQAQGRGIDYGYIDDLIIKDGRLAAVVVTPDASWRMGGRYAYPWYSWGWRAGQPYYDLPYTVKEASGLRPFDKSRVASE